MGPMPVGMDGLFDNTSYAKSAAAEPMLAMPQVQVQLRSAVADDLESDPFWQQYGSYVEEQATARRFYGSMAP